MVITRYAVNGAAATALHYLSLYTCVEILNFKVIGLANIVASSVGILASFVGNKYFVFKSKKGHAYSQLVKFVVLYAAIAVIHGTILYLWSDIYHLNYNYGFLIAVNIQFFLGFFVSKLIVFNELVNKSPTTIS